LIAALTLAPATCAAEFNDAFATTPTLAPPAATAVLDELEAWLSERGASDEARRELRNQWTDAQHPVDRSALLDRLADAFASADPRAKELVDICSRPRSGFKLPDVGWLAAADTPAFEARNLRVFYGRWLAHQAFYDELLEQVKDLDPAQVADPATLLFCQSVAYHRLLDKDEGLKTVDRLLHDVASVPTRYKTLATLMRADLDELEDDSLDHIARRMDDIRRRLDLGRAGKKVRTEEDGVIASLDKMIEEMEKQQQQQQSAGGSMQPSSPMQDSRIAPLKGPGEVEHRNIGNKSGWGDLPAKQREQALQEIGKDFPPHYRDVIEQYFRRLASEGSDQP
jgi:hypothetical protein